MSADCVGAQVYARLAHVSPTLTTMYVNLRQDWLSSACHIRGGDIVVLGLKKGAGRELK